MNDNCKDDDRLKYDDWDDFQKFWNDHTRKKSYAILVVGPDDRPGRRSLRP